MLTTESFTLDTTITFSLWPASILGASISRVKVTDILSYETARLFVPDLQALHASIYPFLPVGVPNDPTQYKYIKVVRPNGSAYAYGIPWIVDDSVEVYAGTSMQITLDNLTAEDQNRVIQILSAAGYRAMDVKYPNGSGLFASGS